MTREQIRHELRDVNAMKVSRATGLHFQTIRAVRDGNSRGSDATINILSAYFEARRYGR